MDNKHHHIVFKKRCEVAFLSKIFTLPGQIYSICWESTILNINVRTVDHVWLLGNMNVACSKSKPLLCGIVSYLFKKLSTSESLWLEFPSWLSGWWILVETMRLSVRSLASLRGLGIWRCCELWCRTVAAAPIEPLAWEPLYAAGAALEKAKKRPKKKKIL